MVRDDEIKEIREIMDSAEDRDRRSAAQLALALQRDDWHKLVETRLRRYYRGTTVDKIRPHISTKVNIQQRVVSLLGVAYRRHPRRELRGAGKLTQRKLLDLYRDAGLLELMPAVGQYSWLLGRVGVMIANDGRARLLYPSQASVTVEDEYAKPSIVAYDGGAGKVIMTDRGVAEIDERGRVVKNEEHKYGKIPIEWARSRVPTPGDWWCAAQGRKLSEATLEVAELAAAMKWIRSQQNRKVLEYTGQKPDEVVPSTGHLPDSEIVTAAFPNDVRVDIHDLVINPDEFIREIKWTIEVIAEQYGIPSSLIDRDTGSGNAGAWSPDAKEDTAELLSGLRDDQVQQLYQFEIELAAMLVKRSKTGITEDKVRKSFVASWPPIMSAQNPSERIDAYQKQLSLGHISPAGTYQMEHPTVTIDEAEEQIESNLKARARFIDILAKRNMPGDASHDGDTLPQKQGQEGGRPRKDETEDGDRDDDTRDND